jgi:hypothetical protein
MTIAAKVICDSVGPAGIRLTTMELRCPRFLLAQVNTHRAFSRNARSSRAVPIGRLIEEVVSDPVLPIEWGRNRKGMQSDGEVSEGEAEVAKAAWLRARDAVVSEARWMAEAADIHKQICNRLIEPWLSAVVLVTATDWANFFALRDHPDAQPEMRELAVAMRGAMAASEPTRMQAGDWHVPYANDDDTFSDAIISPAWVEFTRQAPQSLAIGPFLARISAARCRRISYQPWDGSGASIKADLARFDEMIAARPLHASPLEHQAMATGDPRLRSGNFRGWVQFRQTLGNHDAQDGGGANETGP